MKETLLALYLCAWTFVRSFYNTRVESEDNVIIPVLELRGADLSAEGGQWVDTKGISIHGCWAISTPSRLMFFIGTQLCSSVYMLPVAASAHNWLPSPCNRHYRPQSLGYLLSGPMQKQQQQTNKQIRKIATNQTLELLDKHRGGRQVPNSLRELRVAQFSR